MKIKKEQCVVGRVKRDSTTRVSSRVGSGDVRNLTGRVESGQEVFKSHGSGRVTLTQSDPRQVIRPVKCLKKYIPLPP